MTTGTALVVDRLRAARLALAHAETLPEISRLANEFETVRDYARRAEVDQTLQNECAILTLDTKRKGGRLLGELVLNTGGRPSKTGAIVAPVSPTLKELLLAKTDAGAKHKSARWQKLGGIPDDVYQGYLATCQEEGEEISEAALLSRQNAPHVSRNAGDNEWYTPGAYIEAARRVMGGIDLDPASTEEANTVVGATKFYTAEEDGLQQPWAGRVWMNPPYAQPIVTEFCLRLCQEYQDGNVTEACALVNNATETVWFQTLLGESAAVCLPKGRIVFWHPRKESAPLQGQAILYLGPQQASFCGLFRVFGRVLVRVED